MINEYGSLIKYFYKQNLYRFIWDKMKRNSTVDALFDLISRDKKTFISQFSDAKSKGSSLNSIVLKPSAIPIILKYGFLWIRDYIF